MGIPDNKPDKLDIRVTFNRPTNGQELNALAKAFDYLADRTGVAASEIEFGDHEYDDDKQYAAWETEGLG
jgi:hypothetical protein